MEKLSEAYVFDDVCLQFFGIHWGFQKTLTDNPLTVSVSLREVRLLMLSKDGLVHKPESLIYVRDAPSRKYFGEPTALLPLSPLVGEHVFFVWFFFTCEYLH